MGPRYNVEGLSPDSINRGSDENPNGSVGKYWNQSGGRNCTCHPAAEPSALNLKIQIADLRAENATLRARLSERDASALNAMRRRV